MSTEPLSAEEEQALRDGWGDTPATQPIRRLLATLDRERAAGVSLSERPPVDEGPDPSDQSDWAKGYRVGHLAGWNSGLDAALAAAPRPEGLERIANAIFESMVRPETIWWDDLTPELQEPYLRAARAVARLSRPTDAPERSDG